MSNEQIIYEARLAKEGRKLTRAGLVVLTLWISAGGVLCFVFTPLPDRFFPLAIFALGAAGISAQILRTAKLRSNAGFYRISIDDYGLYVHSDDPSSVPSFSVIAPDVHRLVCKTIKQYERSDDHEYYVETKSGTRHQIEQLFTDYNLNASQVFEKIISRFPWVEVVEEVQQ
jgi:hypothetical protein